MDASKPPGTRPTEQAVPRTTRQAAVAYVASTLLLTLTVLALNHILDGRVGLVRTVYPRTGFAGEALSETLTTELSLDFLEDEPETPKRFFSVEWSGFLYLPRAESIELYAGADDRVEVVVDAEVVIRRDADVGMGTARRSVQLAAGPHEFVVRYEQERGGSILNLAYASAGEAPGALPPMRLFPRAPDVGDHFLSATRYWLTWVVLVLWLAPLATGFFLSAVSVAARLASALKPRAVRSWRAAHAALERATGLPPAHIAQLAALTALAIAHPLFDVITREPAFFIARNTTTTDLVAMVAVLCVGLPAVLVGTEILLTKLAPTLGSAAHALFLTALGAAFLLPVLKRIEDLDAQVVLGAAILGGGVLALACRRLEATRRFMTALTPAILVVPAIFLLDPAVQEAVVKPDDRVASAELNEVPPIVFIVFDEFPLSSLMNIHHEIDRVRYPNFARLADSAIWYRNATTVSSQTVWAVPAILSGRYPVEPAAVPTRRYYPNNIFTILGNRYRTTVFGRFQQLCPGEICDYDLAVHDSLAALLSDLAVVYAHIVTPEPIASRLPPVLGDWRDFRQWRQFRSEGAERVRNARDTEMDRFLDTISGQEGRLYFLHTLTPHMPFEYVPSGHRYIAPDYQGHEEGGAGLFLRSDPWLSKVLQQRHLLQVGFADRFIGRLIERLEAQGIFDDALIVVTADHGVSFRHGLPRRSSVDGTHADVMWVPLFLKLPGQRSGRIRDRNAETVDIVPTIAEALSTTLPYEADGRSLLDATQPQGKSKTLIQRSTTRISMEKVPRRPSDRYASLQERIRTFGRGLYALGPDAALVGRHISSLDVRESTEPGVSVRNAEGLGDVDLSSHTLPLYVRGNFTEGAPERLSLAIALNDEIVATTQSYREGDAWVFASMIPVEALVEGANDLRVFVVKGEEGVRVLERVF